MGRSDTIDEVMKEIDKNGTGDVDFEEFRPWFMMMMVGPNHGDHMREISRQGLEQMQIFIVVSTRRRNPAAMPLLAVASTSLRPSHCPLSILDVIPLGGEASEASSDLFGCGSIWLWILIWLWT